MNPQDWRAFIRSLDGEKPSEVLHVREEIDPSHEITAFMTELEKEGTRPGSDLRSGEGLFDPRGYESVRVP